MRHNQSAIPKDSADAGTSGAVKGTPQWWAGSSISAETNGGIKYAAVSVSKTGHRMHPWPQMGSFRARASVRQRRQGGLF